MAIEPTDGALIADVGGGSLLVIERLLPERALATPEHAAVARSDLNMLVGLAGRERSLSEYRALFERAGLSLRGSTPLTGGFEALEAHGQEAHADTLRTVPER